MKTPSNKELFELAMSLVTLSSTSDTEILLQGWREYDDSVSKKGWLHGLSYLPWLCTWMDVRLSSSTSYENPSSEDVTERVLICGALQTAVRLLELNRISADQIRHEILKDIRPGLTKLCSVVFMVACNANHHRR